MLKKASEQRERNKRQKQEATNRYVLEQMQFAMTRVTQRGRGEREIVNQGQVVRLARHEWNKKHKTTEDVEKQKKKQKQEPEHREQLKRTKRNTIDRKRGGRRRGHENERTRKRRKEARHNCRVLVKLKQNGGGCDFCVLLSFCHSRSFLFVFLCASGSFFSFFFFVVVMQFSEFFLFFIFFLFRFKEKEG